MAPQRICSIPDCGKPHKARGWCVMHYFRWGKHGDPLGGRAPNGEPERFFREVVLPYQGDDCLIWPFGRTATGYAEIRRDGRNQRAHRAACEEINGPPPTPEHDAAHSCGRGKNACVNPRHVRWATGSENERDKVLHGTSNRGERQAFAKLTRYDVREIRSLKGKFFQHEIAEMYGVHKGTIYDIFRGKNWAWLEWHS